MCGMHKGRRLVTLAFGMLKFNVDGVARGKPRFADIRGVLCVCLEGGEGGVWCCLAHEDSMPWKF